MAALDVTTQGDKTLTVHLGPEVTSVTYTSERGHTLTRHGGRDTLAGALRRAGYTVVWADENPHVVAGSRSNAARAAASRDNGKAGGRPVKRRRIDGNGTRPCVRCHLRAVAGQKLCPYHLAGAVIGQEWADKVYSVEEAK